MRIEKVKINPQLASEMLTHNTKNRRLSNQVVRSYAYSMKNGEWQISPEPISFYQSGELRDGQHRLNAVIASGQEIEFYVAYDVPNESTLCDRQVKRTYSNILQMAGYENSISDSASSGAIRFLIRNSAPYKIVPDSALVRFAAENSDLISKANLACRTGSNKAVCRKASVIAAFICANWCGVSWDVITRFAEVANTGFYANDTESAAIAFRNTILSNDRVKNSGELSQMVIFNACANALYDFSKGIGRRMRYTTPKNKYFSEAKNGLLAEYVKGV